MSRFSCVPGLAERAVAEGAAPGAAIAIGVRDRVLASAVYGSARTIAEFSAMMPKEGDGIV